MRKYLLLWSAAVLYMFLGLQNTFAESNYNPDFTPTPYGIRDPKGVIDECTPAISGDYEVIACQDKMEIGNDYVAFDIQIHNLNSEKSRLFRYNVASIKMYDDRGKYYDTWATNNLDCTEANLHDPRQIQLQPNEKYMLKYEYNYWCNYINHIPGFIAKIPPEVKSIFLEFDGFGPFSFSYKFDL
ncbi:MAG TPA: hypothetical protein PK721_06750 [Flexilinea sp.]|nr:hypothetical protein [Flexilinea sp.]